MDCVHPKIQAAATEAERWANRVLKCDRNKSNLILCGESGTGKTHIAKALLAWVSHMGVAACQRGGGVWTNALTGTYMAWPEAADGIRNNRTDFLQDCFASDVLILDDVGAEKDPFKDAVEKLCQILSRRETRFTVITTNVKPDMWETKFDFRISDRFFRNSQTVDLTGMESYTLLI